MQASHLFDQITEALRNRAVRSRTLSPSDLLGSLGQEDDRPSQDNPEEGHGGRRASPCSEATVRCWGLLPGTAVKSPLHLFLSTSLGGQSCCPHSTW